MSITSLHELRWKVFNLRELSCDEVPHLHGEYLEAQGHPHSRYKSRPVIPNTRIKEYLRSDPHYKSDEAEDERDYTDPVLFKRDSQKGKGEADEGCDCRDNEQSTDDVVVVGTIFRRPVSILAIPE